MNIVCPRCHSTAGGTVHPSMPDSKGKWIYYLRHFEPMDKGKGQRQRFSRRCLIGSDLSILHLSDPRYEDYLCLLYRYIDDYSSNQATDRKAGKETMLKAIEMLKESGWSGTLSIGDKIKSDIVYYVSTGHDKRV